ncbi:aminoacyl-tRNA hydrolase, partial [bacterium CG17_big_fil_post_rev_8_21_14_2_50_64_8]
MVRQTLIVGLGNPGPEYRDTRHNVGFRVLEAVARDRKTTFESGGELYREAVGQGPDGRVTLLAPLTYMNRSGRAVSAWMEGQDDLAPCGPEGEAEGVPVRILVVCDDLNLPLGSVRLRARGGSGGQNGLADILEVLGTEEVCRLRLGIAPRDGEVEPADWADFVLKPFMAPERDIVEEMIAHAASACTDWLEHGTEHAAS